ncbi:MAG: bifunctional response regulator/alkaline phosphatase family protein [Gemmatimonadetes bacterium]|nr:bifunctional response regulator/alkaline phosphatase family protein [Gemmatimonadota bacterium]
MPAAAKQLLWVDDEADLLESHRLFLTEKGYEVEMSRNASDALELLRRRPFDLLLLDEQMPGMRGLTMLREVRELVPTLPVVMVTKSEDDGTLRDALGVDVSEYLVKPINPRQVLSVVTRILEGPRIRQQAMARSFVERFRELEAADARALDWRGWIDRYAELVQWDVELAAAGETGLHGSLRTLFPETRRAFAQYVGRNYPQWVNEGIEGERPPLSIDVVGEFLLPVLEHERRALFIVVDCLRLDQWRIIEPLLAPLFEVETTHYFSILPTATPYARNALFSGLFPGEIAARYPDWWGARDDETLNAHERELLEANLRDARGATPVRYHKISSAGDADTLERNLSNAFASDGVTAFVFNFIDLLTHGRSESAILYEVARDEIALRQLTLQWFNRSPLLAVLQEAARKRVPVLLTSDHGSIHCNTPATVHAKRDATQNLRYKFGADLRAENPEQALQFTNPDELRLPPHAGAVGGGNTILATGDCFFVYPTKLREYQQRYRGSFLHGGVTPEEVILPLALLTPRG